MLPGLLRKPHSMQARNFCGLTQSPTARWISVWKHSPSPLGLLLPQKATVPHIMPPEHLNPLPGLTHPKPCCFII